MSLLTLRPDQLKGRHFSISPVAELRGRVVFFEEYDPDGVYGAGADFALGLDDGDYDCLQIVRGDVTPMRQVAIAHGHWGTRFDRVMYPVLRAWNEPFLIGEAQGGGIQIQHVLWNDYGYTPIYRRRIQDDRRKKLTMKLGWAKTQADVSLTALRTLVTDRELLVFDGPTRQSMTRAQYAPQSETRERGTVEDGKLKVKVPGQKSPDEINALYYAVLAVLEAPKQSLKPRPWAKGAAGDVLGMAEDILSEEEREALEDE